MSTGVPSPLLERATELERQLATEQQKHSQTRELLQRAEHAAQTLQTRSKHDAMAQKDELDGACQATVRAQRMLDNAIFELQLHTEARRSAKTIVLKQATQPSVNQASIIMDDAQVDAISSGPSTGNSPAPKKRGRPRTRLIPEPKPVRWWTSTYRAKAKG